MQPIDTTPITQVEPGMTVVDPTGAKAGTVTAIQQPGTTTRPDLAAGIAERLMATGYVRIDGTGELSNDTYASAEQIAAVAPGTVSLRVSRGELFRTES
ncbi:hypothetical protein [Symbioplanes lichenis]|uniref:hypothetical protein n=1 Tax=Symbioplanes lichenis TaxID=1629072 RepID=UPI00273870A8|nr:hypothetical protein [Actinoplanes lichenis]